MVALLGAAVVVASGVVEQSEAAVEFVDWNTIGFLAGMMIIVAVLNKTGVFEYLAIKSAQWGKARPGRILIGSAAGLSFADFVVNLAPLVILTLPVVLGLFYLIFRKDLRANKGAEAAIRALDAGGAIRDRVLLRKSLLVLGVVIFGFFLHGLLHLEAATIALFGAAVLMLYAHSDVEEVLREVEWPTLLFFVGLFVLVGGLEVTGFVGRIAEFLTGVRGSLALTAMLVMWGSAAVSGIVDNIPFTATMIPVIQDLAQAEGLSEAAVRPLCGGR